METAPAPACVTKFRKECCLNDIRIVDARMGRGKTSAAVQYMSTHPDKKFIYVTPYLSEVGRICKSCDFEQPESSSHSKLSELKELLYEGKNVSTTHSLFSYFDWEVLDIVRTKHYSLIVDEAIDVVERINLSDKDFDLLLKECVVVEKDTNIVHWTDENYTGSFSKCKEKADKGSLYCFDHSFISVMSPDLLRAFDDVIMMTYLFDGQYQKAYLDFFGFKYRMCGIDDSNGYEFTETSDSPPRLDYTSLIKIINDKKLNEIGENRTALSKTWYDSRGRNHHDIIKLRGAMAKVFRRMGTPVPADHQLWTTFKSSEYKLLGDRDRYKSSFLQMNARATNKYRDRDVVLYLINRFADPNIQKFFSIRNIEIDEDKFALSEMLQFIWRSAIRDGKPIILYVPSRRMRELLVDWINEMNYGGDNNKQQTK